MVGTLPRILVLKADLRAFPRSLPSRYTMQERSSPGQGKGPPYIDYLNAPGTPQRESEAVTPPPPPASALPATPSRVAPEARRSTTWPLLWLLVFLIALVAGVSQLERITYSIFRARQRAALDTLESARLTSFSHASKLVAEGVGRSVVPIEVIDGSGDVGDWLAGAGRVFPRNGQGSGVIVDEDGYVITNYHVISTAEQIVVHLPEGSSKTAEVVGFDAFADLAVLKIDAEGLLPLKWGDSDVLTAGDPVWAIGSPFGLDNSITMGIVSAKGRRVVDGERYQNYLQTDAVVNPGNSGGALVNIRGELVGINTAIVGQDYRGISFAIPSGIAREVYERIRQTNGNFQRGWLGVRLDAARGERRQGSRSDTPSGAHVAGVLDGSPAETAGIQSGDIIVEWNGRSVADRQELMWHVAGTNPGVSVEAKLLRDGETVSVTVKVGAQPEELQE
ncbi:MAG: PDZ domain-containing protein [Planctomycetota bacterium]|nr:MAG: PDZ domain-containing protein [Planctomycetota bacterium]REJ96541.1 MAG: PDZ domain-containing protein [Planctomycetota bacterium]